MRSALAVLALLALASFSPPSSATIDICTSPAAAGGPSSIFGLLVTDVRAYKDGSCSGTGVVGGPISSWIPPCTVPGTYVVPGGYCGITIPPAASVICHWFPLVSTANFLTVGFDVDGDGHIFPSDGKAFTLANPFTEYQLVNPHNTPARVIAYPTHTLALQTLADQTFVECV